MADREHDPADERPQKRARIEETSTAETSSAPAAVVPIAPVKTAEPDDTEKEIKAGITEYVCPGNLGFSGILKRRYTDFQVNEIGLDGKVVHLTSIGLPSDKEKSAKAAKDSVARQETIKEEAEPKGQDVEMKDARNGAPEETTVPAEAPVEAKADAAEEKPKEDELTVPDEDMKSLHGIFGEDVTAQIIALVKTIRKHPTWKARDFTAVTVPPIDDKEKRTQAHQILRRVFPNMLESAMEPDQSLRVKASPPAQRGNKKGRGDRAAPNPNRMRGALGWEELGGEYLHFTLYKENKDTMEVVGFLGSVTGGGAKSYGFAGTKDRRACTTQRVCVKRQTAERMAGIGKKLFNAYIGDFEYKKNDIGLGDLLGNEFVITLRDCHFQNEAGLDAAQRVQVANDVLTQAVKDFSEKGFINYYGLQRFGSFAASTDAIGIKLLQGNLKGAVDDLLAYSDVALAAAQSTDESPKVLVSQDDRARAQALHIWKTTQNSSEALKTLPRKFSAERNLIQHLGSRNGRTGKFDRKEDYQGAITTIPRNLRMMYVHAYQSLVWNVVAGKRWTTYGDKVVEGDLVLVHEHKDKEAGAVASPLEKDSVDQDGEVVINPEGDDSADNFERARPLSKEEAESGKYTIFDVVLPQPGWGIEYPRNAIGDFYKEFMGSERGGGLDPHNMRRAWRDISLSGGYRKFLARPLEPMSFEVKEYTHDDEQLTETDLQRLQKDSQKPAAEEEKKEAATGEKKIAVTLKLQLASSQYATMALRELLKAGGVKPYQPEFMGGR